MKTTKAIAEPAPPIVKFVANMWHQANRTGVKVVHLRLDKDEFRVFLDSQDFEPPPANLFGHVVREFLRYSGARIWPWTRSLKAETFCIEAGDTTVTWTMSSDDLSHNLTIRRN